MRLEDVTAADLRTRYPIFKDVADGAVNAVLEEARGSVGETWIEADQKPALLALSAHLLVQEGVLAGLDPESTNGGFGSIVSMKAADHEIRFASGTASAAGGAAAGGLKSTPFGLRYLELRRRSFPSVLVV